MNAQNVFNIGYAPVSVLASLCVKKRYFEIAKEMHAFSMNKISTSNDLYIIWIIPSTANEMDLLFTLVFFWWRRGGERNCQKSFSAEKNKKQKKQKNDVSSSDVLTPSRNLANRMWKWWDTKSKFYLGRLCFVPSMIFSYGI